MYAMSNILNLKLLRALNGKKLIFIETIENAKK